MTGISADIDATLPLLAVSEARQAPRAAPRERVAILVYNLSRGGAERGLVNLIKGLHRQDIAVDLLIGGKIRAYADELPDDIDIIYLKKHSKRRAALMIARYCPHFFGLKPWMFLARLSRNFTILADLAAYLRQRQPDVIFTTLPSNNLVAMIARRAARVKTRLVIREANTLSLNRGGNDSAFKRLLPTLAIRWYPQADSIITVSKGVGQDLAMAGIPASKIITIYNPLDFERIEAQSREAADHPFFSTGVPVILSIGRLHPQKDHATLLDAFAKLRGQMDCRLLILGEGRMRNALLAQVERLGIAASVDLPGNVDNPFKYLSRASLFVLASRWEGFPNVLLEALACRCPIVATDCPSGGPAELLRGGRYGHLLPVGDAEALAAAMAEQLARPADCEPGFRYVQDYSVERATASYLDQLLPGAAAAETVGLALG